MESADLDASFVADRSDLGDGARVGCDTRRLEVEDAERHVCEGHSHVGERSLAQQRHGPIVTEHMFDATTGRMIDRRRAYISGMRFDGQVWFDFSEPAVWQFYRFVRALAEAGHEVALEWKPLPRDGEEAIAATFLGLDEAHERGRFLHAAFGLVHGRHEDPTSSSTVEAALAAAGIDTVANPSQDRLDALRAEASDLGVIAVPAMYRHGPVVRIELNGAATMGNVALRAGTILHMLDDDGIWGLTKP